MVQSDAKLIQQILQGNQDAFGPLVRKHQKGVHALVWRKIGDFHIAQEITQDAFLKAYDKLGTLKNHKQFPGWLYVIAANLSRDWLRKRAVPEQSLEETDTSEVDQVSYSQHIEETRETDADETRREVVKKLLEKLPESERTVMTLHYLGEMTIKAISEFLGVSQNTIKSRLSRARNRLRQEEDVIQLNVGSFQLPDQMAENIMREVARRPPISTSVSKPAAPLALSAASAVLIFLLMGVGTQYLSRFQKPYNLDAVSEPTVEIIDAVFVLDSPAKPAVRHQPGSSSIPGEGIGAGQNSNTSHFAPVPVDREEISTPKPQWVQTGGPEGGGVQNLFMASNGDLYAVADTDVYRSTDDGSAWHRVNNNIPIQGSWHMTDLDNVLYAMSDTEIITSEDRGETWNVLGTRPEGELIGTVTTDEAFYFCLVDGVFRSVDAGKSWISLNDSALRDRRFRAITAIENTVFVGTDSGIYRLSSGGWEQLAVGEDENIQALANAEHRLYAAVGSGAKNQEPAPFMKITVGSHTPVSLYRSTDLGDSWEALNFRKIDAPAGDGLSGLRIGGQINGSETQSTSEIIMVAAEENVLVLYKGISYYSNDSGETWNALGSNTSDVENASTLVSLDGNTFYGSGGSGIYRTTDAGKTWHQFNTGLVRTTILGLASVEGVLYANTGRALLMSSDGGESWTPVPGNSDNLLYIAKFNGALYARGVREMSPQLFHLSAEDDGLATIPGMPTLEMPDYNVLISEKIDTSFLAAAHEVKESVGEDNQLNLDVNTSTEDHGETETIGGIVKDSIAEFLNSIFGSFAVSSSAYYAEHGQKLFRWKSGTTEWYDTGLVDEGKGLHPFENLNAFADAFFRLAVLERTVYVGKQDGRLFQSYDEGDTWNDITADIPFSVTSFNGVAFAGSTVYVATDKGVAYSNDGTHWHATIDAEGTPLIIDKLAVDGTTVYGTSNQQVYALKEDSDTWQRVTPEIPVLINSLAVDSNMLYVGTIGNGVLRFTLEESP